MLEFPLGFHFLPQTDCTESCLTFADAGTCVWLSRYSQGLMKLDGKCRDCLLQGQCMIGEAASAKQTAQACQQLSKKLRPGDAEGSAINTTKEWQIKTYRARYTSSGKIYGNFLYYALGQRGNYATTIRALSKVSSDSSLAAELRKTSLRENGIVLAPRICRLEPWIATAEPWQLLHSQPLPRHQK